MFQEHVLKSITQTPSKKVANKKLPKIIKLLWIDTIFCEKWILRCEIEENLNLPDNL